MITDIYWPLMPQTGMWPRPRRDRDEIETFDFNSETRPRPKPSKIFSRPRRDRNLRFWVRGQDRDGDIFRDVTYE